ncbi:enoyl-CoA hydratase/isomerase family protein [Chondromyces crocatus]|uniref:Enoyl-CoA hydratase n=1 Tax=Chondromyces crocatus TaxID=52 RepID=A0A0K1EPH5_CHOCO|nr:enoyl-CoA hydratase/isomerase family protein [Chondromyces crocatus]AKT42820.1 enoyl-CoA hydratase [Chondromyces crocatus]
MLKVEPSGSVVVLTLDRPERRNAIDRTLARALGEAVRKASNDASVRAIVLTAAGDGVFTAGGDIREIAQLTQDGAPGSAILDVFQDLVALEEGDVPIIAAVHGDVFGGGCELLLLCDFVLVEEQATLAFRHARMGLSPAWGGLPRLVERVGPLHASRLLLTAERIGAAEAFRIGLVNEVVPRASSRAKALALAEELSRAPRSSVAALKHALRKVREEARGRGREIERDAFTQRWGGADHRHALDQFLQRK